MREAVHARVAIQRKHGVKRLSKDKKKEKEEKKKRKTRGQHEWRSKEAVFRLPASGL